MNNSYNHSSQSPRYIEVSPNGQVLHQSSVVPSDVLANFPTSQRPMTYNSTSSNAQSLNYPYQTPYKKDWCYNVGPFYPYRTWNQEYGRLLNRSNSMSNLYYTGPNMYGQGFNMNGDSSNSFSTTSYLG